MSRRSLSVASALLLQAWITPSPAGDDRTALVFEPSAATELEKRFDFGLRLECWPRTLDREELVAQLPPVRLENSVRFVDRYAAVAGGKPLDFVRHYEQLSGRWWYGDGATEIDGFHALTGADLRFVWDSELGDYSRSWMGQSPRFSAQCPTEDMDFRGLLPAGGVSVGDRWTARGPALIDALWASTELGLCGAPQTSSIERLVEEVLVPPLRSAAAETVRIECEYSGLAPVRDGDVHRIALRVDERIERDLAELANQFLDAGSLVAMSAPVEQLTTRWTLKGKGALDWDAGGGHFAQFELSLEVVLDARCTLRLGDERFVHDLRWTGRADWSARATRRALD